MNKGVVQNLYYTFISLLSTQFFYNFIIVLLFVWKHAITAVFYSIFQKNRISSTLCPQRIQRAITKQTIKFFCVFYFMAGKELTFPVTKKLVTHIYLSLNITLTPIPAASGPVCVPTTNDNGS